MLDRADGIDGYELNLSCPNVPYSSKTETLSLVKMFAHDDRMIEEVVSAVRQVTDKTLIAKLGPDVSDVPKMALAAENEMRVTLDELGQPYRTGRLHWRGQGKDSSHRTRTDCGTGGTGRSCKSAG